MSVDQSFLPFFLDEAADILADWEKSCLELAQPGGDQKESSQALFRAAHNLKSGSAAVGLNDLSHFVHGTEDLISQLLSGSFAVTPHLVKLFLDAQALIVTWLAGVRSGGIFDPGEARRLLEQEIKELRDIVGAPSETLSDADVMELAEGRPLSAPDEVPSEPSSQEENVATRLPLARDQTGQLLVTSKPAASVSSADVGTFAAASAGSRSQPNESVRVASHKLDILIQLVGELSTHQAIVWHARQKGDLHSKSCDNAIQLMQKNAKELQSLAMALRMQPLQNLFQRLERAGSDLARSQGKKVTIMTNGDHVELDRAVIERVTEALMHVIRNAVDHGIEQPATRLSQGKSESATIKLESVQEPGGISLTISDDGRGLLVERILEKAIERGLAKPEQKYSHAEIQRFIFAPGFSTSEKVTDVSGRGVGMDVVKTSVETIGGSVAVTSQEGLGTTFAISLPTTLSILDALVVEVDGGRYAVPVQDVREIIDLNAFRIDTGVGRGRILQLRESVVAVGRLGAHLPHGHIGVERLPVGPKSMATSPALVVMAGERVIAFEVDRVSGQQPVSVRPLPLGLSGLTGYTGAAILGDGDPCAILNLPALGRRYRDMSGDSALSAETYSQGNGSAAGIGDKSPDEILTSYLLINVKNSRLAVPLSDVREILSEIKLSPVICEMPPVRGYVDVRGQILQVLDLGILFQKGAILDEGPLLVMSFGQSLVALMVSGIEAVLDLVPQHLPVMNLSGQKQKEEAAAQSSDVGATYACAVRYQDQIVSVLNLLQVLVAAGFSELSHELAASRPKIDQMEVA